MTDTRPTFVLVWPDGTVTLDDPDSFASDLGQYLESIQYGTVDEPIANLYAIDREANVTDTSPLGMPLRQCAVYLVNREVDGDDWIYLTYEVRWVDNDEPTTRPSAKPLATLNLRIDGRA